MLPFIKPKRVAGLIISQRKPDEPNDIPQEDQGLKVAAKDLISAVQAGDEARVAAALRAAFDILGSMPPEDDQPSEDME